MQTKRKLVIPREKWLRGEGLDESRLLREYDQKQCCVGLYLECLGVPREILVDQAAGNDIAEHLPEEARWLLITAPITDKPHNSSLAARLYEANDWLPDWESDIFVYEKGFEDESARESRIIELFAEAGVEVTFE